jgi:hypothetical protein
MCFSASASFASGAVLSSIGVLSLKKVQNKSEIFFASIPLFFGIQQFIEGFLWLTLTHKNLSSWQSIPTHLFLFFAQVIWPILVPYAFLKLENDSTFIKLQQTFTIIGTLVSCYLAYCLFSFYVEGSIIGHHISYLQDYPLSIGKLGGGLYVIATVFPPFFSSVKGMRLLGVAIVISYMISHLLFSDYLVSVWCFFASIISLYIYYLIDNIHVPIFKNKSA